MLQTPAARAWNHTLPSSCKPAVFCHDDVSLACLQRVLGDRYADIAEDERVPSSVFEDFSGQRRTGRLAVGAGDADKLRVTVAVAQLNLADDLDAPLLRRADERNRHGNDGTDHDQRDAVQTASAALRPAASRDRRRPVPLVSPQISVFLSLMITSPADRAEQSRRADAAFSPCRR